MAKKSSTTTTAARRDPSTDPIATGVFAFEGDWESDLRDPWSIEPMLRTLQVIGGLKCIRRNVATVPELEHYLDKWLQKRNAGYQVGYFGFHGGPGSVSLGGRATSRPKTSKPGSTAGRKAASSTSARARSCGSTSHG